PGTIALAERLAALDSFGVPAELAAELADGEAGATGEGGEASPETGEVAGGGRALGELLRYLLRRGRTQPGRKPPEPDRGVPLLPIPGGGEREEAEEPPPDAPPGLGHNGPPAEPPLLDDAEDVGEIVENELRPGIRVRGNPNSGLWTRFTDALASIPGDKSRK